jgi:hypothetical protein
MTRLNESGMPVWLSTSRFAPPSDITYFVALPFDVADGSVVVGEPIECLSPAAAIERAQGLWKVLGHTGAVAFSRTGDPATGDFRDATVLRNFGDVPDDLSAL